VSKKVIKIILDIDDSGQQVYVPHDFNVLMVGSQSDTTVSVWGETCQTVNNIMLTFSVFGTGHPIPEYYLYVGTAINPRINAVWHVYAVDEDSLVEVETNAA